MTLSADSYLDTQNLMDIRIVSTLGLTEEDITALRELSDVRVVQGDYSVDAIASGGEGQSVVKTMSLPNCGVNMPYLLEGSYPEDTYDCLVEEDLLETLGLSIGDTITFDTGSENGEILEGKYRIVGTCTSPLYISISRGTSSLGSGSVDSVVYLQCEVYTLDYYTDIYLCLEDTLSLNAYSDAYTDRIEEFVDAIEEFVTEREKARTMELKGDAQKELASAWEEYESTSAEIEEELQSAIEELASAREELDEGWKSYEEGVEELSSQTAEAREKLDLASEKLAEALVTLEEGEADYADKLAEYEDGEAQYEDALVEYETAQSEWETAWDYVVVYGMEASDTGLLLLAQQEELATAQAQLVETQLALEQVKIYLDAAREELDEGWAEYESGLNELAEGEATLEEEHSEAQAELDSALADLEEGEEDYTNGLAEYEDGKAEAEEQLADALTELEDAQEEIDSIEDCEWYVLDRSANLGFASYQSDADNMGNLASVFPLLFFLVAALVCLTTMTRMVEEERVQIGGLKALGYTTWDISRKYVCYGLLASLGGSIIGLALGCTVIPYVIITCWQIMYSIPTVEFAFCPGTYLFSAGTAVVIIVGTVLGSILSVVKATPATLMRPRTPKAGKRIFLEKIRLLWKRLSFTHKVTARNLFRYQKRFWMTVIGIGSCTALIVTGFGIQDSINDVLNIQYDELNPYHATALFAEEDSEELCTILDASEDVSDYCLVHYGSFDFEGETTISGYYLVVDSPEDLDGFQVFRDRVTGESVELSDEGILICEKLSELLDIGVGDTLVLSGDERVVATVVGIVENHAYNYVYLTQNYYITLFGERAEMNEALLLYSEDSEELRSRVGKELLEADVISSITQIADLRDTLNRSFESINYAVLIVIVSAAALAFVVLYNLSNINITERRRELATLKVLGFHDEDMNAYVLRENVILTLLGTILGLVMGRYLHHFLVKTVEVEMMMFGRTTSMRSYVYAVILTLLFSMVVSVIASRSLKQIDMVESLKSVE